MITRFRQVGSAVIAYENNVHSWPVAARCRVLLAGANHLLDSGRADFAASLRAAVTSELLAAQNSAAEAHDVMTLAEKHGFIGESSAIRDVFRQVIRISQLSDLPVLIIGESGTGKELIGTAIRGLDPKRRASPFVAMNCPAINTNLAESELFGYVRGAFTGATAVCVAQPALSTFCGVCRGGSWSYVWRSRRSICLRLSATHCTVSHACC
jgi:transcriptional regulator of acetoin/glycerol metabolism